MLVLLSPAKSLDYATPLRGQAHTDPLFVKQSQQLIKVLRTYTPPQISQLMDLSDTLAGLNVARYQAWRAKATPQNARQAVLAFDGDVYDGLNARSLDDAALDCAQQHVCMLSGLYGVLRPLDLMQPYRLEMGTRLPTDRGKDLYAFWGDAITDYLNSRPAHLWGNSARFDMGILEAAYLACGKVVEFSQISAALGSLRSHWLATL